MRLVWTFFAGVLLAGLALFVTAPILAGVALVVHVTRGDLWTVMSAPSYFAVRDDNGRLSGRAVNVVFRPLSVLLPGDGRPRPVLARLEIDTTEFSAGQSDGRIRLDVWPVGSLSDVRGAPLYRLLVPGRGATLDPDGMMVVERGSGRRGAYGLADGAWLFDADSPFAILSIENERRRYVALARADDELPPGAVAVLSYASPQKVIRRVLISADDPVRGRFLRGTVASTRPSIAANDTGQRTIELPLPAGLLRIAVVDDDLDLTTAAVPAGLRIREMRPWVNPRP